MSRIGKKPVIISEGVTIEQQGQNLLVRGTKGEVKVFLPSSVKIAEENNQLLTTLNNSGDFSVLGRARSEIANAVQGVTQGWSKTLEIIGTGYRASTDGQALTLNLGFSHPVEIKAPNGVTFQVAANKVTITGADKVVVGRVAAVIKKIRPVEPYKGKGIRYEGEVVRRKQGKAAKSVGGT